MGKVTLPVKFIDAFLLHANLTYDDIICSNPNDLATYEVVIEALTQDEADQLLASLDISNSEAAAVKASYSNKIQAHAFKLIKGHLKYVRKYSDLDFVTDIWPMLDITKAPPHMKKAMLVFKYARGKIEASTSTTDLQALIDYDPSLDTNWPL